VRRLPPAQRCSSMRRRQRRGRGEAEERHAALDALNALNAHAGGAGARRRRLTRGGGRGAAGDERGREVTEWMRMGRGAGPDVAGGGGSGWAEAEAAGSCREWMYGGGDRDEAEKRRGTLAPTVGRWRSGEKSD
jgi:hypothetical protein